MGENIDTHAHLHTPILFAPITPTIQSYVIHHSYLLQSVPRKVTGTSSIEMNILVFAEKEDESKYRYTHASPHGSDHPLSLSHAFSIYTINPPTKSNCDITDCDEYFSVRGEIGWEQVFSREHQNMHSN